MCGIAGVFGAPIKDPDLGTRMADRLRHRGPDLQRTAVLPNQRGVFAHTRLSIIDLSESGSQPFASSDGNVVVVFNGEIYEFQRLRDELIRRGSSFRSTSDTEVILELYRVGDIDALSRLDGMFAFALFDATKDRLILMRDRFGKKPLYFSTTPSGALVFASEIKALLEHPEVEADLLPSRLPELLAFGYVETPGSLYRNIQKLPPGHLLLKEGDGAPRTRRYFDLETELVERHPTNLEDAKAEIRRVIGSAVEKRLVSDVPVGAFLSGGIDSSIVVYEMAKRTSVRPQTFSVGFSEEKSFDESPYARLVARLFDTRHTELTLPRLGPDVIETLLYHHDEPFGDSSALALYAISKVTREHVKVVLTGDGGDEAFAGYTRFVGGLVDAHVPSRAKRWAHRLTSHFPEPRGYKNPAALAMRFVEHAERTRNEQLLAWNTFFIGPSLQRLLGTTDPYAPLINQAAIFDRAASRGLDRLHQILLHNIESYLLDDLLVKADRSTMAVGLEARSPFLDPDVVRLAFSMPSHWLVHNGSLKWILREAYRDVLPPAVLDRRKHGFGVPVGVWWKSTHASMVDDLLMGAPLLASHLEVDEVRRIVTEHRDGHRDHGQRIFLLLVLELWLRKLRDQRSQRVAS